MYQMFIKMPSFANHILMASYAINPILFRSLPAPRSWSVTGLGGGLINVSLEKIRFSGKIQLAWIVKTSNLSTPTSRTKKSIIASTLYPIKQVGYCLQYIVMENHQFLDFEHQRHHAVLFSPRIRPFLEII